MADVSKVRSAYAFFQGKRQPVGGETAAVATVPTVPVKPVAPTVPVQPQPAVPGMAKDQFSGVTQIIAELERRIGELETALKAAKAQQGTVATPPINPVPANQVPVAPQVDKAIADFNNGVNQGIAQASNEIDKFNVELNQGINKVNQEVARVAGQINQVNQALQTQIPAISGQINQTVNSFKGLIDAFKGIKF